MRYTKSEGQLSVHIITGSYAAIIAMDMEEVATKGLLGFAIKRQDNSNKKSFWLNGFLGFENTSNGKKQGDEHSTQLHPIQDFIWGDYTVQPGNHYVYSIYPVYGTAQKLIYGDAVVIDAATESEADGINDVYFNRGVAGSQGYVRKFGDKKPQDVPNNEAYKWLSRGLEEAFLNFISQAKDSKWSLHAACYEFTYEPILNAFKDAAHRGVNVEIIYDDKGASEENRKAIEKCHIKSLTIPRKGVGVAISHNKFVLLLKDNKPVAVWTGSTNLTLGGLFGHSNVGHSIKDTAVANEYFSYWNSLAKNTSRKDLSAENTTNDLTTNKAYKTVFSPQSDLSALNEYAKMMDKAESSVFLTAAFGVSNEFTEIFERKKSYLRYLLMDNMGQTFNRENTAEIVKNKYNRVAVGDTIHGDALEKWHNENLTGYDTHVRYVHTKYMLLDPLSDNPIVITGSANFSEASTTKNDENMLICTGNKRVADIYLTEFMRLFMHFRFRNKVDGTFSKIDSSIKHKKLIYLQENDDWCKDFYKSGSIKFKERLLFQGKAIKTKKTEEKVAEVEY